MLFEAVVLNCSTKRRIHLSRDDESRAHLKTVNANGIEFAYLERGKGARLALFLHGFPDDAGSMIPLMDRLSDEGYRCVAPFMRGYHPTSAPKNGNYQIIELARDAAELVGALGHDTALLIGHDWGAVASYAAAVLAPERFPAIVAMSVPPLSIVQDNARRDPRQLRRSWYTLFFQLPFVAKRRLAADNFALVEWLWHDWSPDWDIDHARLADVKRTFASGRTAKHALAYYRAFLRNVPRHFRSFRQTQKLIAQSIPGRGLVLAGGRDECMGLAMYHRCERAFEGECRYQVISHAGHFLPLEAPDEVAEAIKTWLNAEG